MFSEETSEYQEGYVDAACRSPRSDQRRDLINHYLENCGPNHWYLPVLRREAADYDRGYDQVEHDDLETLRSNLLWCAEQARTAGSEARRAAKGASVSRSMTNDMVAAAVKHNPKMAKIAGSESATFHERGANRILSRVRDIESEMKAQQAAQSAYSPVDG